MGDIIHDFETVLSKHKKRYPKMTEKDAVKLAFQSAFGAAHLADGLDGAVASVKKEFESFSEIPGLPPFEDIGGRKRLLLRSPDVRSLGYETMARYFFESTAIDKAEASEPTVEKDFSEMLSTVEKFFGTKNSYLGGGCPNHSDVYRAAYEPSYRVISARAAAYFDIISKVTRIKREKGRCVIAIDGRCASGKTTAAEFLSKVTGGDVIHMDDFFLTTEMRTKERLNEVGGNIDYERFLTEVAQKLPQKAPFSYLAYDCKTGRYRNCDVTGTDIVIIEGVYSLRNEFRRYYDIEAVFHVSKDEQLRRLKMRSPHLFKRFVDEWVPLEEKYFDGLRAPTSLHIPSERTDR